MIVNGGQNFDLHSNDILTQELINRGVKTWQECCELIQGLPYGRNSNRSELNLVLFEGRGTCSSKHAYLKKIADLNNVQNVELILGLYKMSGSNTPKLGSVLVNYGLEYIPEAHCYLKIGGTRVDYTSSQSNIKSIVSDLIIERAIEPHQVSEYKVEYHKNYLKKWLKTHNDKQHTFEYLWGIREECIRLLSL